MMKRDRFLQTMQMYIINFITKVSITFSIASDYQFKYYKYNISTRFKNDSDKLLADGRNEF